MSLAAFIADQRTSHQVPHSVACRALAVSESWFYKWHHRRHEPTPSEHRRAELDAAVAQARTACTVHREYSSTYVPPTGW